MDTAELVTVELVTSLNPLTRIRATLWVAHGPDGHHWLLARTTQRDAMQDGLAYFLATRSLDASGRWVIA